MGEAHAIDTTGLTRRFGRKLAVQGLDLAVPKGAVYGFLGPNGAGKTTTIRMLLGLIRPDAGQVRLFDASLASERLALMRRVGALVETPSLYPHLTGAENLEVTRRLLGAPRARIDRALGIVRLSQDAGRRVREYSLGMRQRLGLALALLNEPDLLILDEPTNGLDPAGIHEMRDLLRELPARFGISVFLSSHLLGEVEQIASHIGIIHQGRALFQGPLSRLQEQRQEYVVVGSSDHTSAQAHLESAGWEVQRWGAGLLKVAARGRDDAARVNAVLVGRGIGVFHLAIERDSLEDIFLALTNGSADGRDAAGAAS